MVTTLAPRPWPRTAAYNSSMRDTPIRTAALLMIGEELLQGRILDTNSWGLARKLAECGVRVVAIEKVGDREPEIAAAVRRLLKGADLVITSGGLGPTFDDVTFSAVARGVRRKAVVHPEAAQWLEAWMAALRKRGRTMTPAQVRIQRRQARLPAGAVALRNHHGSAPGSWLETAGGIVASLPGVPRELFGLYEGEIAPRLRARAGGVLASVHYRFAPLGEGLLETCVGARLRKMKNPAATVLAQPGLCSLILTARDRTETAARRRIERVAPGLLAAIPVTPFTAGGESPEQLLAARLAKAGATLAVAESLTGGVLAARLTAIPGASNWFRGGAIVYTDAAKRALGVPAELLAREGAVSAAVAGALAERVRAAHDADFALATTGYAGPDGGDAHTPVGGYFAAFARRGAQPRIERGLSAGTRETVREAAATHALVLALTHSEG